MFILYDVVFFIYSLIYFPYLLLTNRWHRDFLQRFGIFPVSICTQFSRGRPVWFHVVSVGEVSACEGLIRQLKKIRPELQIVCSVTTKTGYELAQQKIADVACVIAAPLDFSFVVRRFLHLMQPCMYIAAETEIWPNLFARLHKEGVPIAIVNGRISDRSFGRYRLIKGLLKNVLAKVSFLGVQSTLDGQRLVDLGADVRKVHLTGNIKFDDAAKPSPLTQASFLSGQALWVAGSTHPGEEAIILEIFKKLRAIDSQWRLLIAPRHIERAREVADLAAKQGFIPVFFSGIKSAPGPDEIIVVDTIGHLRGLYAYASLVFVGKSLCVGGGHNVIEPAAFGKPVIIGPKMENFRDIVACFKMSDALVQVQDAQGLEAEAKSLMRDQVKRELLGQRAQAVVEQNRGAVKRTLELIEQWI